MSVRKRYNYDMIKRHLEKILKRLATKYPVVTLTGPRQSGKATLAREAFPEYAYVSLEEPDTRDFAIEDPRNFLSQYSRNVIIDEVQRAPEIFSYLQADVDRDKSCGRFILTGSQNFALNEKISQSLAGRTSILKLLPFSLSELFSRKPNMYWHGGVNERVTRPPAELFETIFTGFYPSVHDMRLEPDRWYREYFETYASRDVRNMLNIGDLKSFEIFMRLLAGRTGQPVNFTSLGDDAGVSHTTARRWLSILEASYLIHILPPFFRNFGKRQIKTPKIYFLDCGFLCSLLRIRSPEDIISHPLRGAIFETFVFGEIHKCFYNLGEDSPIYFWRGLSGVEIDLLIDSGKMILPVEIKSGQTMTDDFFKNLKEWSKFSQTRVSKAVLVYGGNEYQKRGDVNVVPWYGVS